jgi:hypothetical protein
VLEGFLLLPYLIILYKKLLRKSEWGCYPRPSLIIEVIVWFFGNSREGREDVEFLTGECPSKIPQLPPQHGNSQRPHCFKDCITVLKKVSKIAPGQEKRKTAVILSATALKITAKRVTGGWF